MNRTAFCPASLRSATAKTRLSRVPLSAPFGSIRVVSLLPPLILPNASGALPILAARESLPQPQEVGTKYAFITVSSRYY